MGAEIAIPAALAIGGALLKAKGQREEAAVQRQAAEYNAALDDIDAELAVKSAKFQEKLVMEDVEGDIGAARAVAGAQGFATESITNQQVFADIRRSGALDISVIRTQGSISQFRSESSAAIQRETGVQSTCKFCHYPWRGQYSCKPELKPFNQKIGIKDNANDKKQTAKINRCPANNRSPAPIRGRIQPGGQGRSTGGPSYSAGRHSCQSVEPGA